MPKTASRGLGAEITKAALRGGDQVVAGGRRRSTIAEKLGPDSEASKANPEEAAGIMML